MPRITILEIKKRENSLAYDLVEENVRLNPELMEVPGDTIAGTEVRLTVRTGLPDVNFSILNEGVEESDDESITRFFQTAFLDQLVSCDVRLLGAGGSAAAKVLSEKQAGYIEAAIRKCCSQFWYGKELDPNKGFMGLIAQMKTTSSHIVDATGSTDNQKQSVFLMARGRGKVEWLFGSNRTLTFDEWVRQTLTVNNKSLDALISWMHFNPGVRLGNRNALVRIKNITEQTGKTLTFDHLVKANRQMRDDLGQSPDVIFMTGRSQEQLRDSLKTELNPNPPLPTEWNGIPFQITHNLATGETF